MSQQVAKQNPITTLRTILEQASPKLAAVAPKHLKVERLVRLMLASCSKTPAILNCTPESVLNFCMKCSETGLEPIGAGGAWAIPFGKELMFIPDYRGLVNCAKRAECIKDAFAEAVYSNDEFDYELGMSPSLTHKPARGDRGSLESAYCIIVFTDDTKRFVVMDKKEIEGIRARSKASKSGPWVSDESEMWKKTVVRRAMKPFTGASQQLDAAIAADDAVNGLKNVTERAPVPMPKEIEPEPTSTPETDPTPEPATETKAPGDEQADNPAEPAADPKTFTGKILGVNPAEGKKPAKLVTEDSDGKAGPRFTVWDKSLIVTAQDFSGSRDTVTITYEEVSNKGFTNYEATKIERGS